MNEKDITALISLLDDPDEEIFSHIREKLLSYGSPVIPFLEREWEKSFESVIQTRIENIIHHIQFNDTFENLRKWVESGGKNLLSGIILIARYQYPDLDEAAILKQIERIIHEKSKRVLYVKTLYRGCPGARVPLSSSLSGICLVANHVSCATNSSPRLEKLK